MAKVLNRDLNVVGAIKIDGTTVIGSDGTIQGDIQATAGSIGTAELADSAVSTAKIADDAVSLSKIGPTTASGITSGVIAYKSIDSATVKALLDGSTNNLAAFSANEVVIDVIFITSTAAGSAATVNVGTDANWSVPSDADAFITAVDANAQGAERMTLIDVASQAAGAFGTAATGAGNVTITASTDISASSWAGQVVIAYIPV